MKAKPYAEAPLLAVLRAIAATNGQFVVMSDLARQLLRGGGYPAAYEAIGRTVAAGYAEYDMPPVGGMPHARMGVRLTAAGRARVAAGDGYPQAVVAVWRRRQVPAQRSPRWRMWHRLR